MVRHLTLANGVPALIDPLAFETEFAAAQLKGFGDKRRSISTEYGKQSSKRQAFGTESKLKSKIQTLERYANFWFKKSAQMVVLGARLTAGEATEIGFDLNDHCDRDKHGNVLVSGDDYFKAVSHCWGKIFAHVHASPGTSGDELLSMYAHDRNWDWQKLTYPYAEAFEAYLAYLKNIGVVLDGIHNYCWKHGNEQSFICLIEFFDAHTGGAKAAC